MPQRDRSCLQISARHLGVLQEILAKEVPHADVWAYGSRVTGGAHEGSDLDLVLRNPADLARDASGWIDLVESLQSSQLPMLVQVHLWSRLPASFQRNIEAAYVVIRSATDC